MFPKKVTNWSRMPFAPGSKTRPRAAVRREARDIDDGLIRHSPILRMPSLISIFLICFLSGTVWAQEWNSKKEDSEGKSSPVVPVGSCQPSSAMSLLAAEKQVFSFVPKGSWLVPQKDIGLVSVEPYAVPLKRIPTTKPVTSCASNSRTGQTVCTTTDKDVYVFTPPALSPSTLQSAASGMSTFFGGQCMTCAVTMDAVHNKALLSLSLLVPPASSPTTALAASTATSGFQYIDLGEKPQPETAFRSEAPPAFNPGGEISKGILIDPIRNWILSPNESGNFEIIKVVNPKENNEDSDRHDETANEDHGDKGNKKGDDNGSDKTQLAFFENNPTTNPGINDPTSSPPMPASFASAGEECRTGIAVATVEFSDPSEVYLVDLTHVGFSPGSPGSWPTPSSRSASTNYQSLDGSSFPDTGPNGVAVAQGTSIGVLAGMKSNSITAFKLPESVPGKPPVIKDWVTCGIPGMTGVAPHTLNAYQSPNTGHAMATVGNLDATVLWRIDLTEMLKLQSTAHICNSVSLPPDVLHAIAVP
jgi:hypothetical protein